MAQFENLRPSLEVIAPVIPWFNAIHEPCTNSLQVQQATEQPRNTQNTSVAIIGCGIGGAALALALQQRGIRAKVYERDASFDCRKQG